MFNIKFGQNAMRSRWVFQAWDLFCLTNSHEIQVLHKDTLSNNHAIAKKSSNTLLQKFY